MREAMAKAGGAPSLALPKSLRGRSRAMQGCMGGGRKGGGGYAVQIQDAATRIAVVDLISSTGSRAADLGPGHTLTRLGQLAGASVVCEARL